LVIAAWLVAVAGLAVLVLAFGANTSNNLDLPGTDSQAATDLLAARFPPQQNGANPIVFHAESGKVTTGEKKQAIQDSHAAIKDLPHVASAPSPFTRRGQSQVSRDGQTAFIPVLLRIPNSELTEEIADSILEATDPAQAAGLRVAAGGTVGSELSEPKTEGSEVVGLTAALIILAITFGALVAAGMPIVSALVGLVAGLSLIGLLGHVVTVPSIAPTLATMIGLGVGVDYALFLVSRYRSERDEGAPIPDAIATAVATSGTAIVFAGSTVVIALVTLLVAGIPLVTALGYASAFAVATAVLAAITLLPAVLAALGPHIDAVPLRRHKRPAPSAAPGIWGAWAGFVTTHPWRAVGLTVAILIPLIIPVTGLNLGQEDVGATPKSTTQRQAYDLMSDGFGPGYNGPLLVAVELGEPARPSKKFRRRDKKATDLKQKLETEQRQLESEAARLTSQADALESQQAALEAEGAALESQAVALEAERTGLEQSRAEIADRTALRGEIDALAQQAEDIATAGVKLAAQEAKARAELDLVRRLEARMRASLAQATDPRRRARLERRLTELEAREAALVSDLTRLAAERRTLERRAQSVSQNFAQVRDEAAALGSEARSLGEAAAVAAQQALALEQSKDQLTDESAAAQVQAANLQTQQAELEAQQQQAKRQQRHAEKLKRELTNELTKAGGDRRGTDTRLVNLQNALADTIGVKVVSPPQINDAGSAAIFTVIPTTRPAATRTADLVRTVRDYVIPQATAGTDLEVHVGGQTASYVDLAAGISSRLVLVIAAVVALGFIVLMTAFRSTLVAGQAAIANILSVTAAFGVVTLCFQEGWGLGLVGVETDSGTDPIASFVPLIMFAVLFGLSMDYQVFLVSQIEQHRASAGSDREAIAAGLATGARVITAAALIMISVFASFILNGDPTVKQFGVGLAVGVAFAAMTVLALAPALMVLAGRGSWWVPRWADRVLPRIDIEGARADARD
jgi:uncharacterized membrane protein YdfJ with MMPL/SSD domain